GRAAPPMPPPPGGGLWKLGCRQLWVMRNSIYKRNGYCFSSRRAIDYFGNAGCWTRNPRLSPAERRRVEAIRRVERAKGCR
ncbi:MAG TPA: YARHG domain-containing protein, partial [Thermopetrobacter sp.]|nr:YARHG domain-containing protein [Thermopetrobacter sp.]